jgi:hypothetical protein
MAEYIRVSDLNRKARELRQEIRRTQNIKVRNRLVEEEAAYAITLREMPRYEVKSRPTPVGT